MKIVAVACGKCGKHIELKNIKLLPFKHDEKKEQKIWWGCEECQKNLQAELEKGK